MEMWFIGDQICSRFSLEECISRLLIPAITGRSPPNEIFRKILALPIRLGGLGTCDLTKQAPIEYEASTKIVAQDNVMGVGKREYDYFCECAQIRIRDEIKADRRKRDRQQQDELLDAMEPREKKSLELASEKGASLWLSVLPLSKFGFTLHKRAFFDVLALRYGLQLKELPVYCECGASFSVEHALHVSCKKGGFPAIHHNELRDLLPTC